MLPTLIISFREFLEVFLIIGVFFGISKKLKLRREKEILSASILGIIISFILPIITFALGDSARTIITEKNAELLEGYLMIFSGVFLGFVIFSLHKFFVRYRSSAIESTHQKLEKNIFDLSLFLTIVFFVVREGFEIALFTATTSLFSKFVENLLGLGLGFAISLLFGTLTYISYVKFPISRIYKLTEYLIVILGAAFLKNGIGELAEIYYNVHLSDIIPIKLNFLPEKSTLIGHMLKSIVGIEQNFSLAKLSIMVIYVALIYLTLLRVNKKNTNKAS
ncbi:hypothetical protein A3C23_04250 [Candidatus Roizmanbacteria bacterium RIFCSPHIGHO2_02_FULL_37_13b]|uniref:Iron permease n=1 Tax=Candidatus Roizmanbacteria bacterium RIFCSPLOWO2_02_FULL_36_11 TaxID=1802071 RepID=A0A1F7JH63_9BACT|nr:MAG: hypothetical protein A3C23_04250 [Candidatus Roizmanbacteria bacterium RIFCSPHIGHO2_02_FULL_37_13b]OGK54922.1 MAG: hypothetical protein A3H78_00395 [Candidatus Roizmanbacteria bacterium RIFCSPLOWO2_02_FULL_36_11]